MRTLCALALATAFSHERRHRWRQISVLVAAFMATLACCFAIAIPPAATTAYELGSSRGPVFAAAPAPGDDEVPSDAVAIVLFRATYVDGAQVPTVWIEPLPGHEDDPDAVPVGLSHLPAPGAAVLSPGLVGEGFTAEDFGWTSSPSGTGPDGSIGRLGVMTPSEPLIFVRPLPDRTLAASTVEMYVQDFGIPASQEFVVYAGDPEFLPPSQTAIGAAAFVLLPALVLMVSGARARSALRQQRMRFLVTLGVAAWRVRTLIALETMALAAVGSLAAALLWSIVSRYVTTIPVVGIEVRPGELHSPWWWSLATALLIVMVAGGVGAVGSIAPTARRPSRPVVPFVATVALGGSVALLALTAMRTVPSTDSASAGVSGLLVGVFGILVFTPLAMPQVTTWAGRVIQHLPSRVLWATGRRLVAEPQQLSRIAGVLSVLIILVSSGSALGLGSMRADPAPRDASNVHRVSVSWVDATAHDVHDVIGLVSGQDDSLLVLPIVERAVLEEGEGAVPPLYLIHDCSAALRFIGAADAPSCDDDAVESQLEDALRSDIVTEESREGRVATNGVAVFSTGPPNIGRIQEALGRFPGLNVSGSSRLTTAPLPIHRWIGAGLVAVVILVGTAALREIGDRSIDDAHRDAHFARIGLSSTATRRLAWASLLVPMVVSVMLSAVLSTVITYAGQSLDLMRREPFELLVICLCSCAVALLAIAVSLPARQAMFH